MFIYVKSGWVQTVLLYKSSSKHHFILKAYVKTSQKLTDAPYNAWVLMVVEILSLLIVPVWLGKS